MVAAVVGNMVSFKDRRENWFDKNKQNHIRKLFIINSTISHNTLETGLKVTNRL